MAIDGVLFKDGVAQIYTHCICCQSQHIIKAPQEGYNAWAKRDKKIQDAMPMLSEDDRELLISGLCGDCFEEVMQ